jgi:MinD-like ATPase involved in chromosome partitioning or flagellar assembly
MVQHKMWAIGGGKGGVGKSVLTLALSIWLAKLGRKVIVVDADLGGANLHILLGIRYPSVTLQDFIGRKVDRLDDVLIDTPHKNLRLCQITDSFDVKIVANMVKKDKDREASKVVRPVTEKYLDIHLTDLGFVQYDPEIERSVNRMVPFLLDDSKSQAALSTYQIAYQILKETAAQSSGDEHTRPGSPYTTLSPAAGSPALP